MKTQQICMMALLIAASFTSCKKNQNGDDVEPGKTAMKLIRTEQDSLIYATYNYNSTGRPETSKSMYHYEAATLSITYNSNNQVDNYHSGDNIYTPVYTDGKMTRLNFSRANDPQSINAYMLYTYQGDKIGEADYYTIDANGTKWVTKTTSAYNAGGDMTEQKTFYNTSGGWQAAMRTLYEYDDKINPLASEFNFGMLIFGASPHHNITKRTVYDGLVTLKETDIYDYTYNHNGYPEKVQKTVTGPNLSEQATIKFFYQ